MSTKIRIRFEAGNSRDRLSATVVLVAVASCATSTTATKLPDTVCTRAPPRAVLFQVGREPPWTLIGQVEEGSEYLAFVGGRPVARTSARLIHGDPIHGPTVYLEGLQLDRRQVALLIGPDTESAHQLRVECHVNWCRGVFQAAFFEWEKSATLQWNSEAWLDLFVRREPSGCGVEYELRRTAPCGGDAVGEGLVVD